MLRTVFCLGCIGLVACSSASRGNPAPALGTATATSVTCPPDAPAGASCSALTIKCPLLDDANVTVMVSDPPSAAGATILLHNNVGGEQPLDGGFVAAYHAASFRVVQTEWQSDWEQSNVGVKYAACRYATLVAWVYANVHDADTTRGFCAQSWGGGSGGLVFSLAHYGAGSMLDAVTVSAGPPLTRIDLGCTSTSSPTTVCGETVPVAYSGGPLGFISTWEVAPTCGSATPSSSDVARWANDSILSDGALLAYPQTSLAAWYCSVAPDATIGQGSLFFARVTTEASVHCVASGAAGACNGETPWPGALPDMVADMKARCIPRH